MGAAGEPGPSEAPYPGAPLVALCDGAAARLHSCGALPQPGGAHSAATKPGQYLRWAKGGQVPAPNPLALARALPPLALALRPLARRARPAWATKQPLDQPGRRPARPRGGVGRDTKRARRRWHHGLGVVRAGSFTRAIALQCTAHREIPLSVARPGPLRDLYSVRDVEREVLKTKRTERN